jgi:ribosomal protein S18 acetylase RimI-like enzyme
MPVRSAERDDLTAIASIHKAQFPTHPLGRFSQDLIAKFYRPYLGRSLFLVHEGSQGIDGFVLGGNDCQLADSKSSFIDDNIVQLCRETLYRPRLWPTAFRSMKSTARRLCLRRNQASKSRNSATCHLLSIAVDKDRAGTGIAGELMDAFEQALRGSVTEYCLSVRKENLRAIRFYQKRACEIIDDDGIEFTMRLKVPSE